MKCIIDIRIKELRKESGMNQHQLAQVCEVKQSCVSKWERGATLPDAVMIIKLCEIFKVSADYLLGMNEF